MLCDGPPHLQLLAQIHDLLLALRGELPVLLEHDRADVIGLKHLVDAGTVDLLNALREVVMGTPVVANDGEALVHGYDDLLQRVVVAQELLELLCLLGELQLHHLHDKLEVSLVILERICVSRLVFQAVALRGAIY